jgi:TetR/AcrR family fatty acid metabolism transcriptional regulator
MRKKEGNKELDIFGASVRVFSGVGYSEAKLHMIADEAGIASGTIYLYFKNKEDILLRIFESVWEKMFLTLEKIDIDEKDPVRKFHMMIDNVFELFNADPSLATVFVNEQHHIMKRANKLVMSNYRKTLGICEKILNEGIVCGVFKKEIDSLIFSTFFLGGIRYVLQQWAQDQKKFNLTKIRENIKNLVLLGIAG